MIENTILVKQIELLELLERIAIADGRASTAAIGEIFFKARQELSLLVR